MKKENNENPIITIIVPVYNTGDYLQKCIDSIINQTYTNIEIILIDDGSTDNSPVLCDDYARQDNRIVVVHQRNAGVSAARNTGLRIANGAYIGFVDSDDWIEPEMYEVLYDMMKTTGTDISIISVFNEKEFNKTRSDEIEILFRKEALKELIIGEKYQGYMWSKLFSAKLFETEEFANEITICEDLAMNVKIFSKVSSVSYQCYPCYHYTDRNNSAIHVFNKKSLSVQVAYQQIINTLKCNNADLVDIAKSQMIKANISTALLAADSKKLDEYTYSVILKSINSVINVNAVKLLNLKMKMWICVLKIGRIPFIISRKAYCVIMHHESLRVR